MYNDLPKITDWSIDGRRRYLKEYIVYVELIIYESLETFDEQKLSLVFGKQDDAKDNIIKMFLSETFNFAKIPSGIPHDINLFSQIAYWCKFKTGKTISVKTNDTNYSTNFIEESGSDYNQDADINLLAHCLSLYNCMVAQDMVGFWFKSNDKFLNEISYTPLNGKKAPNIKSKGSPTKETKYKADASFRYLCVFLNLEYKVTDFSYYQNKYLVKGKNKPQYVADRYETHFTKQEVRKSIKEIICFFHKIHSEGVNTLAKILLKSVGRKSLLDLYEMRSDPDYEILKNKLRDLKSSLKKGENNVIG